MRTLPEGHSPILHISQETCPRIYGKAKGLLAKLRGELSQLTVAAANDRSPTPHRSPDEHRDIG